MNDFIHDIPPPSSRFQYCGRAESAKEVDGMEARLRSKKPGSREYVELTRGIAAYKEGWISR